MPDSDAGSRGAMDSARERGASAESHGALTIGGVKRSKWFSVAATAISVLILGLSAFIVTRTLLKTDYWALRVAIHSISLEQILISIVLTAGSYLALTGYDASALKQLKLSVPYRTTALASFSSYAISFTLGFPLVTGGTIRYWIYSQAGLRASNVASLTLIAGVTFWLGMVLMIGVIFLAIPASIANINQLKTFVNVLIGAGAIVSVVLWLIWVSAGHRKIVVRGVALELPGFRITLAQICLGAVDLAFASAALFVLLPAGHGLDYLTFAGIYVFACMLGIASNAPGGIGAFEVTILKTVPVESTESLLASLVLFRIVYYFLPFVLAFALLGAYEIRRRWKRLRDEMDVTGK